jgi:uncharacterized protein
MTNDLMDYEAMVRDAYRVIVKKVLTRVGKSGLPGDHHFYIAFDTGAPGVDIPGFLRERYPQEMTIVLQNDFWGLEVDNLGFEVNLHFDGRPSRMVIPFDALTGFLDPSVQFGVKFDVDDNTVSLDEMGAPEPAGERSWADEYDKIRDEDAASKTKPQVDTPEDSDDKAEQKTGEVISLSNFRKD